MMLFTPINPLVGAAGLGLVIGGGIGGIAVEVAKEHTVSNSAMATEIEWQAYVELWKHLNEARNATSICQTSFGGIEGAEEAEAFEYLLVAYHTTYEDMSEQYQKIAKASGLRYEDPDPIDVWVQINLRYGIMQESISVTQVPEARALEGSTPDSGTATAALSVGTNACRIISYSASPLADQFKKYAAKEIVKCESKLIQGITKTSEKILKSNKLTKNLLQKTKCVARLKASNAAKAGQGTSQSIKAAEAAAESAATLAVTVAVVSIVLDAVFLCYHLNELRKPGSRYPQREAMEDMKFDLAESLPAMRSIDGIISDYRDKVKLVRSSYRNRVSTVTVLG